MFNDGTNTVMPVAPVGNYGGNFLGGGDGLSAIIWLVVIIAIFGGLFNGNGWFVGGNGNMNAALTRGELCQDMNFSDLNNSVGRLQQSVSDGFANQNMNFVDRVDILSNQMATGFDAVNLAITRDGYETRNAAQQNMIANMQNTNNIQRDINDCCCKTQNGFQQIAYQQSTDTCDIKNAISNAVRDITDNNNANTRSLYDFMVNQNMQALRDENQSLKLYASQERQNNYLIDRLLPTARPAYITCSPYASSYGNGNCCGCGQ